MRRKRVIYPKEEDVFRCFRETLFDSVKVVVIGQDPYHDGNADGLAFSCKEKLSPSLTKIYETILNSHIKSVDSLKIDDNSTYLTESMKSIDLYNWAKQGVLLLNSVLTVEKGFAGSHSELGWQYFTGRIIRYISTGDKPIVFLLWGKDAQEVFEANTRGSISINITKHLVIKCEHPVKASYENREWRNGNCFNLTNEFLEQNNMQKILW